MSVLSIKPYPGESGSLDRTAKEITVPYIAETDDPSDGTWAILTHPDCPKPWQPHGEIPGLFVRRVLPDQRPDAPNLWDLAVEYAALDENPLQQPAKIRLTTAEYTRLAMIDAEGKPVVSTAWDILEEAEVEDSRWVILVEKNIRVDFPAWITEYENAVNADAVTIRKLTFPDGTLKLKRMEIGEELEENGVPYSVLSFQLHHRREGWESEFLNRGYHELTAHQLVTGTGLFGTGVVQPGQVYYTKERILGDDGEPMAEPQFLDINGRRPVYPDDHPRAGEPKSILDPEDIVTRKFKFERRLPFNGNLPLR